MTRADDQSTPPDDGLSETLASYRTGEDFSEDGAMALAMAKLPASRWDYQTMVRMAEASADEIEAELNHVVPPALPRLRR